MIRMLHGLHRSHKRSARRQHQRPQISDQRKMGGLIRASMQNGSSAATTLRASISAGQNGILPLRMASQRVSDESAVSGQSIKYKILSTGLSVRKLEASTS
ncbi:hypothetical protein D9M72_626280 [compost metagenome]